MRSGLSPPLPPASSLYEWRSATTGPSESICAQSVQVTPICDRDTKWSATFRQTLAAVGIRVVHTPHGAPDCNAYAERFVRSIKEECLDRLVILGQAHLRRALREFAEHYHAERNHQGLHDRLIVPAPTGSPDGTIRCHPRLGGLLRYYYRAA